MCPRDKVKRNSMRHEVFKVILDKIVPYVNDICPFLYGEPAEDINLIYRLGKLKTKNPNARITLYSNMARWEKEDLELIVLNEEVDFLNMSFYGPTPELYAKYQPGFNWIETRQNIRYLIDYMRVAEKKKPYLTFHYLITEDLIKAFQIFEQDWYRDIKIGMVSFDTFHGEIQDLSNDKITRTYFTERELRMACKRPTNTMTILSNGDVVPCCIDFKPEMVMGNILEQEPIDIWNNNKFKELRWKLDHHRWDELSLCKNCTTWRWHDA